MMASTDGSSASPEPERAEGRAALAVEVLRIGLGLVWAMNLVFIVDPANQFFPTFSSTASSYAPTTLGGPGLAQFVAAHGAVFSVLIAVATAYLAFAFLTGTTTRWACVVGFFLSGFFLVTQWGSTFYFPGGTDVGPHPPTCCWPWDSSWPPRDGPGPWTRTSFGTLGPGPVPSWPGCSTSVVPDLDPEDGGDSPPPREFPSGCARGSRVTVRGWGPGIGSAGETPPPTLFRWHAGRGHRGGRAATARVAHGRATAPRVNPKSPCPLNGTRPRR